MDGLPRGYDEWRTRNQEDEDDEANNKRAIAEARAERADYEHDREKDERSERRHDNQRAD